VPSLTSQAAKADGSARRSHVLWLAAVIIVSTLAYIPSLGGDFTLDDWPLIVDRPMAHSLRYIPWAFSTRFLPGVFGHNLWYYRPLTTVSYQINYVLSGPHALPFRATNLGLEVLAAALIYYLARRLGGSMLVAGVAGIAFGVLPAHAEATAWISGRTDLLSAVFTLCSLIAFIVNCRRPKGFSWGLAILSSVLFLCGLLSKEQAIVLPALMTAYVWVYGGADRRAALKWCLALAPSLLLYLALRHWVLGPGLEQHLTLALGFRLLSIGLAYASYLRMLFVPMEPRVIYDSFVLTKYPLVALAAWLLPLGLVALAVWSRRRAPIVAFGAAWVFIALLPVSNLLPPLGPLPAERFAYLASVGSALLIGWCSWTAMQWHPRSLRTWPAVCTLLICGYLLNAFAYTVVGSRTFDSDVTWARAIQKSHTRFQTINGMAGDCFARAGAAALRAGDLNAAREHYAEAAVQYEAVLKYLPGDTRALSDLHRTQRLLAELAKSR